jgi:hypothetical protein
MAISTINGKMAVMVFGNVWEPPMPIVDTGTLGQDDQQHLIWGYPETLWGAGSPAVAYRRGQRRRGRSRARQARVP